MKAVVLHGPGDLRLDDLPEPALPPGGLVVRPLAVGICGSDVRTWRHGSSRLRGAQVLGHEIAGVVAESDVAAFAPGMPVAVCPGAPCEICRACRAGHANLCPHRLVLGYDLPGGMAELLAVPADWIRTGGVVPLDPTAPIERGAFVEPLHTVINGQDQVRIVLHERVLVLGLGPIGVLHVAAARSAGAMVVGLDLDPDRVARAATIVGAEGVDRLEAGPDGHTVAAAAEGRFDVVIVAVGAREALATAVASVEPCGRILAFAGLPLNERSIELDMNDLHNRQLTVQGAFGGTPDTFRRAASWLVANPLDTGAFAPGRFPLHEALRAFEAAAAGHGLKTLLVADDGDVAFATG